MKLNTIFTLALKTWIDEISKQKYVSEGLKDRSNFTESLNNYFFSFCFLIAQTNTFSKMTSKLNESVLKSINVMVYRKKAENILDDKTLPKIFSTKYYLGQNPHLRTNKLVGADFLMFGQEVFIQAAARLDKSYPAWLILALKCG